MTKAQALLAKLESRAVRPGAYPQAVGAVISAMGKAFDRPPRVKEAGQSRVILGTVNDEPLSVTVRSGREVMRGY